MKKRFFALWLFVVLLIFGAQPALAAGSTICIVPEDFKGSEGTFSIISDEKGSGKAFRNTALRGITDSQSSNTIPAQVNVEITEEGTYAVWVHTRDYDTDPGRRYFKMGLDKSALTENEKLGAHKENGWKWEKAGSMELKKGIHTVKVYDTSAFYARLDMIVLTTDEGAALPNDTDGLNKLYSEKHMKNTGITPEIPLVYKPNQVFLPGKFYTAFGVSDFHEKGTWKVEKNGTYNGETAGKDMNFIGLPNGKPEESKDATVTFAVPSPGKYYIWIHSRDFADRQGLRTFSAGIDDTVLPGVYGDHGIDGWGWERKEIENLTRGYHTFHLIDSKAVYARCDYFLITNDEAFVPQSTKTALYKLLAKAAFDPESVTPDLSCPVAAEPVAGGVETYPMRPGDRLAVSFNGYYINCAVTEKDSALFVDAANALKALGFAVHAKNDVSTELVKDGTIYKFTAGDRFALKDGRQKIEMRAEAFYADGTLYIPLSFLNKIDSVSAKQEGLDACITYRIWK